MCAKDKVTKLCTMLLSYIFFKLSSRIVYFSRRLKKIIIAKRTHKKQTIFLLKIVKNNVNKYFSKYKD